MCDLCGVQAVLQADLQTDLQADLQAVCADLQTVSPTVFRVLPLWVLLRVVFLDPHEKRDCDLSPVWALSDERERL